jgi:DNA topoisomerase-1
LINAYVKQVMGQNFSVKDFRTWAGTLVCACALARAGVGAADSQRERKRKVGAAIGEAAALLGNTPAICRTSYVQPVVLSCFNRGQVVSEYFNQLQELTEHWSAGLHPSEKALLALLKASTVRAKRRSDVPGPLARAA